MRIGLIADTHIREPLQVLPSEIASAFHGVDLILHAGDIYTSALLDSLELIAPVFAASGDDDSGTILADARVKPIHRFCLEKQSVVLAHANPYQSFLEAKQPSNVTDQIDTTIPNVVIFGHTHYPLIKHHSGILFINPGSPFNHSHNLGTIALLCINQDNVYADLIFLSDDISTQLKNSC